VELEELGPVKYIIAPNKVHHMFVPEYLEKFPEARLYLAPGLKERVPEFEKGVILKGQMDQAWEKDLDMIMTAGNSFFSEVVLFHKESKILIVADFIMNFPPGYFDGKVNSESLAALATQFFSELPDKPMCSPEHSLYCTDVKAFQSTSDNILAWEFESIIMSHGEILDDVEKAKHAFSLATESVINKVKERWSVTNSVFSFFGSKK